MSSFIFGFGLLIFLFFLLVRLGIFKSWAILKTLPGLMSARMFYALLPMSLEFMVLSFLPAIPGYDSREAPFIWLLLIITGGGPLLGFWFMYRPPKWIVPRWLRWLEQEYGYCADILLEEAQRMDRWQWEMQVRTQVGMQAWIDAVFVCRQKDIDFAWKAEKFYLIEQQVVQRKSYVMKPGMTIESDVPVHRQGDITITREEIDEVVVVKNAQYRMDDKYRR